MKLQNFATLVLVGWYLMCPPTSGSDPDSLDLTAPISKWLQAGSYNTLDECEAEIKDNVQTALRHNDPKMMAEFGSFQCIEADDPRLKGN